MEIIRTTEKIIENPKVIRASELPSSFLIPMAINYASTWRKAYIGIDDSIALAKIRQFNPDNIFVLTDSKSEKLYAQIYTVPVRANSIKDFAKQFPTYKSVEEAAQKPVVQNPNVRICFSLNCTEGIRVKNSKGEEVSLARTLLTRIPKDLTKIAYSFIPNVYEESIHAYYLKNLNDTKKLGPVGMHESMRAVTVATLENSRPEHVNAGYGNALVLYPRTKSESELFGIIKRERALTGTQTMIEQSENASFFMDSMILF